MLAELLAQNRQFDAEYQGGLSNHLSMALVALQRLGAPDARLRAYFDRYRRRLVPRRAPSLPLPRASWQAHRGTQKRYADYLVFFEEELRQLGLERLLGTYLPPLLPGLSAAAFHAQIRLAYALEAQDPLDVAASLAYFADSYLPLGPGKGAAPLGDPPIELLRRLARTPELAGRSSRGGLITDRMAEVAAQPAFAPVIDWLPAADATLDHVAEAALVLYASTGDFTALHGLTGTHALRIAWPFLPDPALAARYLFQALCAAYVSIGTPPLLSDAERARLSRAEAPSWRDIGAAAIPSSDEHVIKLVYSARQEDAAYHDPLYRHVAAKKAGLTGG
jgi:hypothetical protein